MKFVFLTLLYVQIVQSAFVLTILFRVISQSNTIMDIFGNAFKILILNMFDDFAAIYYKMYLEPFEN